ncbi:MAG: aromatic amino acid lyase [Bacteroidetes bacterium]|nr:aromatic amino acid lyase [Bacteroidota bacterium]
MVNTLTIDEIEQIAFKGKQVVIGESTRDDINKSFSFLVDFSKDKIIYGINTGFGPMVQFKVESHELNQLQYNLIRSHSNGAGNVLNEVYARAVVVARLNNFLQGHSGISPEVISLLTEFLNHNIIPEIFEHGGVGASGDLVQLAHLGLNLIGEGYVYYQGKREKTGDVLNRLKLKPLTLKLRDGLGIINGTSCMTGIAAVNLIYAQRLLKWGTVASAVINEVIESFDDSFSEELNAVKQHHGQQQIASQMRQFLEGSHLVRSRKELFSDHQELSRTEFKNKIQEYYSIRCVPQILGPVFDTCMAAIAVTENELNSTNDNPVVIPDADNVFHGGNFHGDYISLEMDKLKLAMTKLTVLAERQLNFLLNKKLNRKFPPFLNKRKLGFNFGLQGMQFVATSTTAESQSLCTSVYVHSIPNNNDNQDVVSMGTNSALIAKKVIDNGYEVMAVLMMAVAQAIDLLPENEFEKLAPKTKQLHKYLRSHTAVIEEDIPQFENIRKVVELLKENHFTS